MFQQHLRRSGLIAGIALCLGLGISVAYASQFVREERGRDVAVAAGAQPSGNQTGQEAARPPVSSKSHQMTVEEYNSLVKQGYSPADVAKAADLARSYGGDVKDMLDQRAAGVAWETIEKAVMEQWQAEMAERQKDPTKYKPDKVVLQTQAGLSQKEVDELLAGGLAPEEIMRADGLAALLGLDVRTVLREKRKDQTADDAIREALRKSTPDERKARRAKAGIPDVLAENIVRSMLGEQTAVISMARPLDDSEIAELVAHGNDRKEIQDMSAAATHLGLDPREVVAAKRSDQTWAGAIKEIYNSKNRKPEAKSGGSQ